MDILIITSIVLVVDLIYGVDLNCEESISL